MFLSDSDILSEIEKKRIKIKPFSKKQLQPASYDLRLHTNFRVFKSGSVTYIDVKRPFDVTKLIKLKKGEQFVVHPGRFILAATFEKISLPDDIVGVLEGRSSLGRLGLMIHATAAHIPPGFFGHITYEVSNVSNLPIKLYAGMEVAQIAFVRMESKSLSPYGTKRKSKYQDQEPPTASMIWKDFRK